MCVAWSLSRQRRVVGIELQSSFVRECLQHAADFLSQFNGRLVVGTKCVSLIFVGLGLFEAGEGWRCAAGRFRIVAEGLLPCLDKKSG